LEKPQSTGNPARTTPTTALGAAFSPLDNAHLNFSSGRMTARRIGACGCIL